MWRCVVSVFTQIDDALITQFGGHSAATLARGTILQACLEARAAARAILRALRSSRPSAGPGDGCPADLVARLRDAKSATRLVRKAGSAPVFGVFESMSAGKGVGALDMIRGLDSTDRQVELDPGMRLEPFADGITEATDDSGGAFGRDRPRNSASALPEDQDPEKSVIAIVAAVDELFVWIPEFKDIGRAVLLSMGKSGETDVPPDAAEKAA